MSGRTFYGSVNTACLALSLFMVVLTLDGGWFAASGGWFAAWFYHYKASEFLKELHDKGVIEFEDE